jgi:thiol-disulfide isomerase/thioredoxin
MIRTVALAMRAPLIHFRRMASWRVPGGFLFGGILLGIVGFRFVDPAPSGPPDLPPGPPALPGQEGTSVFRSGTFTTVAGEVVRTDTLAGRVILVNAWATWCGPCVVEMPGFQRVQDELGERGFLVIGISADQEGPEVVRAFVEDLGITYPVTVGQHHVLGRLAAQVRGLPTSLLLDREGRIVRKVEGVFPEEDLRQAVLEILGGKEP